MKRCGGVVLKFDSWYSVYRRRMGGGVVVSKKKTSSVPVPPHPPPHPPQKKTWEGNCSPANFKNVPIFLVK